MYILLYNTAAECSIPPFPHTPYRITVCHTAPDWWAIKMMQFVLEYGKFLVKKSSIIRSRPFHLDQFLTVNTTASVGRQQ
jgi:hypothetical protein